MKYLRRFKQYKFYLIAAAVLVVVIFCLILINSIPAKHNKPKKPARAKHISLNLNDSSKTKINLAQPIDKYNQSILDYHPAAFWPLDSPSGQVNNLSSSSLDGTYQGNSTTTATMPNGDNAVVFNGANQYASIPSNPAFSVSTTHELTWEGWIKPTTLNFDHSSSTGYVEWMGKCFGYSSNCEWAARMYDSINSQDRCDRLSAYIFNSSAGLGSGAFWQPNCNVVKTSDWLYVVGEYNSDAVPYGCSSSYPGSINIWVDGIEWNQEEHSPTGCMSQYNISPHPGSSPLTIGTASGDTWFGGAIGKVAIYDYLLNQNQISAHYSAMTGLTPDGSCKNVCISTDL
jgi:hypothetical protein